MSHVFVDAGPLVSLVSPRDQYHRDTLKLLQQLNTHYFQMVTTDYIISEALTSVITTTKGGYRQAINLINWLFKNPAIVHLNWITQRHFFEALQTFSRFNKDKIWSFTDCTSYVLIKELKIDQVFTFDRHFKQMGFSLLS